MPDSRRNPFEGVTDFFSEMGRMRAVGLHGGLEPGLQDAERTHASAWVPATDIFARARTCASGSSWPAWILRT